MTNALKLEWVLAKRCGSADDDNAECAIVAAEDRARLWIICPPMPYRLALHICIAHNALLKEEQP